MENARGLLLLEEYTKKLFTKENAQYIKTYMIRWVRLRFGPTPDGVRVYLEMLRRVFHSDVITINHNCILATYDDARSIHSLCIRSLCSHLHYKYPLLLNEVITDVVIEYRLAKQASEQAEKLRREQQLASEREQRERDREQRDRERERRDRESEPCDREREPRDREIEQCDREREQE